MDVEIRHEAKRGCGYRKEGGLYLMAGKLSAPCCLLPIPVKVCPCCGQGIRPARGWTWIEPKGLLQTKETRCEGPLAVNGPTWPIDCPMLRMRSGEIERAGLLWIGEKFYPKPEDFIREAREMGLSRRITAIPRDFVLGKTWVLIGHRRAMQKRCERCNDEERNPRNPGAVWNAALRCDGGQKWEPCPDCKGTGSVDLPAIFHAFKPERIEQVVTEEQAKDEVFLAGLEKRGITPVIVRPIPEEEPQKVVDFEH